jgi:hypothetical protein
MLTFRKNSKLQQGKYEEQFHDELLRFEAKSKLRSTASEK